MRATRGSSSGTGQRRALRILVRSVALAACCGCLLGAGARFAGRTLEDALRALAAGGLPVIFTNALVRPEMRVEVEPSASEPRLVLEALLAPHGLGVETRAGATLVVVRLPAGSRPSIVGLATERARRAPLAGVRVRLLETGAEAATDAAGRFVFAGLEPGIYRLEASLPEHLPLEVPGVVVGSGQPVSLALTLDRVPLIHEEILVRPSQLSLFAEAPVAPLALSRGEIESLPHLAGDLFRALSLLPGATANDVSAQVHVHGGRRDEVQVLLDGQELYEAHHLQDFDRALSVVPPEGLADASLSTGAFPATFGDRMSGVLEMSTLAPAERSHAQLGLSLVAASLAGGGPFAEGKGSWLAAARRGATDLVARLLGDEDPSFWDLFGKLRVRLGERQDLRLHLLHADDRLRFFDRPDGELKEFSTSYASTYAWLTHQASFGDRFLVETSLSRSRFDRDRLGREDEEAQSFGVADRRRADVWDLAQSWHAEAGRGHALAWGLSGRRYEASYDYTSELEPDFVLVSPLAAPRAGLTRFRERFEGDHLGAYVTDRFAPLDRLSAELGLRYDRHTLTADTLVSPRANLAWRLDERSVARVAWGHFFQSHRPYELQVEDGETRLEPAERSVHWVLGYERQLGRRERPPLSALRLELYRREVRDPRPRHENVFEPVNIFPEAEPDRVRIAPERSRAQGLELLVRGHAGRHASWWLSWAWAAARDELAGRQVPRQVEQEHSLTLFLSTRLGRHWDLAAAWRFHSGWPTSPVRLETVLDDEGEPELQAVLGDLNSERLPDYHRLDLRLSRSWQLEKSRLTVFADVQNTYDRKNLAGYDLGIDEDTGELLREPESWPGVFPSVGIRWEL